MMANGFGQDMIEDVEHSGVGLHVESGDLDGGEHQADLRPAGTEQISADALGALPVAEVDAFAHPSRMHRFA